MTFNVMVGYILFKKEINENWFMQSSNITAFAFAKIKLWVVTFQDKLKVIYFLNVQK